MNFNQLQPYLSTQSDTVFVVNFWATWCKPCVGELPEFVKLEQEFKAQKFKLILVSLDLPKQLNERLIPFLKKNNMATRVILLNDPDANQWIDKVDETWSGALPATLIFTKNSREFYEKTMTLTELETIVKPKLN